jgi:hypothetical protein
LVAWLMALALLLKVAVPSGYMLDTHSGAIAIVACSGMGPMQMAAMPAMADHGAHGPHKRSDKAELPCAFAGLNAASVAAADPLLLAIAIAFGLALVFRRVVPPVVATALHLRPPLRGPPLAH